MKYVSRTIIARKTAKIGKLIQPLKVYLDCMDVAYNIQDKNYSVTSVVNEAT